MRPASDFPGKLIIVEGIDGSGKSTQIDLIYKWLAGQGYAVTFTEWNSSQIVRRTTKRGKQRRLLSPMSFSLIHAADFANRTWAQILPALKSGGVVLADRYVYTAFARDAVRGVDRAWLRQVYSFAVEPTIAVYFRVPLEESLRRILIGRPELKFYEAGMDLGLSDDPEESFRLFQARILDEYERISAEFGLQVIDATQTLVQQQEQFRELLEPRLAGVLRAPETRLADAFARYQLSGRYLGRESDGL
jgi:dTMP kinase